MIYFYCLLVYYYLAHTLLITNLMTILERLKALPKNILEKLQSLRQTIGDKLIKAVSYVFNVHACTTVAEITKQDKKKKK